MTQPRLGVAGLGRMGRTLAGRLLDAGYTLAVWNRSPGPDRALGEAGATICASPRDLAARAEIVFTFLTDAAAVEAVVLGPDGLFAGMPPNGVLVDMSTISPEASRSLATAGLERGVDVLDAPVAGGPERLARGEVGVMAGGSCAVFDRCRPILETVGNLVIHAGGNGQGSALKLVNNLVLAIALEATAEALVLAERLCLSANDVIAITGAGGAQMRMMEHRGPRMIARNFEPGSSVANLHKDLSAALELAAANGVDTPAAATVLQTLERTRAAGNGEADSAAIFETLSHLRHGPARNS